MSKLKRMMMQTEYYFDHAPDPPPTAAALRKLFEKWLTTGRTPAGLTIEVRVRGAQWSQAKLRAHLLRTGQRPLGCPGVVRYDATDPRMVLCDYDGEAPPNWYTVAELARDCQLAIFWTEYHRTRRGWHMTICFDRALSPAERVALQFAYGSDPGRERYNLMRILSTPNPGRTWNILFERKIS